MANREIARIERKAKTDKKSLGSVDEDIAVLNMAKQAISLIAPFSLFEKVSRPTLWHTDLHMGNMFVSDTDPTQTVSLIDWQSVVIAPLFLQARFPAFLSVGSSSTYEFGMDFPQLPHDFETSSEEEKEIVEFKHVQAKMAKGYEVATGAFNIHGYRALCIPFFMQELFLRCGEASDEGTVPLRGSLIKILEEWDDLRFLGEVPFHFSEETLQKHHQDLEKYRNFQKIQEIAKEALGTDSEGWIPPQLDFEVKRRENGMLIAYAVASCAEFNLTEEEMRDSWPFREI